MIKIYIYRKINKYISYIQLVCILYHYISCIYIYVII